MTKSSDDDTKVVLGIGAKGDLAHPEMGERELEEKKAAKARKADDE